MRCEDGVAGRVRVVVGAVVSGGAGVLSPTAHLFGPFDFPLSPLQAYPVLKPPLPDTALSLLPEWHTPPLWSPVSPLPSSLSANPVPLSPASASPLPDAFFSPLRRVHLSPLPGMLTRDAGVLRSFSPLPLSGTSGRVSVLRAGGIAGCCHQGLGLRRPGTLLQPGIARLELARRYRFLECRRGCRRIGVELFGRRAARACCPGVGLA